MKKELKKTINQFNEAGWVAYHKPIKKIVVINGFKYMKEFEAIKYMKELLNGK